MRFLYLIQGKAHNVAKYLHLNTPHSNLRGLTYDQPLDGFDFLPNSSFAQGRNHQYRIAVEARQNFDYFIFMDDDVAFRRGTFERMEGNLRKHQPSIGCPLTEKTRSSAIAIEYRDRIYPLIRCQRFHTNDEQYLAVSRTVIDDAKIFPYLEDWDDRSWFVCCLIQEHLIQTHYHVTALQFNDCEIANEQHSGDYPHNIDFAMQATRQWVAGNLPTTRKQPAFYPALLSLNGRPGRIIRSACTCASALIRRAKWFHVFKDRARTGFLSLC